LTAATPAAFLKRPDLARGEAPGDNPKKRGPMKHATAFVALALVAAFVTGCGGDDAPAPEEAPQSDVMSVPDSTIERELRTRLDADPRLDGEGIDLEVTSENGVVSLLGQVPSRMEMSIAREVIMSAPGVVSVDFDSLDVLSETQNADTTAS
jgi:hypothetical protein